MYLHFWPQSVDRIEYPASVAAANAAQTQAVQLAAADAALTAQRTVAPVSSFGQFGRNIANDAANSRQFLRRAGSATPQGAMTPAERKIQQLASDNAFLNAPQVVPLNPSAWSAPAPAESADCGHAPDFGPPWSDAGMYAPALLRMKPDWIGQLSMKNVLLTAAGAFGLYQLSKRT
jgi:hypothetical protein